MKTGSKLIRLLYLAHDLFCQTWFILTVFALFSQPCISSSANMSQVLPDTVHISKNLPDEKIVLIPGRKIYLCGEDIIFEAFTYVGSVRLPIASARVMYVELYGIGNSVIYQGKYIMEEGRGSGSISIPRETLSGIYNIRAYTNFMKNFGPGQFFATKIKIVNPFIAGKNMNSSTGVVTENNSSVNNPQYPSEILKIVVETDRKEYGNREVINVKIKATNNYGVPVKTDLTLLSALTVDEPGDSSVNTLIPSRASEQKSEMLNAGNIRYLPEIKGDIISGIAVYEDNQPAAGVKVLQSFTGSSTWIESSVTDKNGRFFFLTDMEKNSGRLILKVNSDSRKTDLIPENEFFDEFAPPATDSFSLTKEEIDMISKGFINIQVDDAFPEQDSAKKEENEAEPAFYGKDFTEYKFPEYLKLPNMKEFIFEVIEGVVYTRENKKETLRIHEAETMNKIGPNPLMVIDGVPVTDASVILELPSEKVRYIRVVRNKYLYKDQIFDGIMDVVTFQKDASSFKLKDGTSGFKFIHPEKGPEKKEVHIPTDEKGKIPVYKNLLYWNTGIATDNNGNAEISFISPDNSGTFTIRCFGFGPDGISGTGSVNINIGSNK